MTSFTPLKGARSRVRCASTVATLALIAVASTAAASTAAQKTSSAVAQLTYAIPSPPQSLDPGKTSNGFEVSTVQLAYDSLIRATPDGTFVPDLATSWGYVGKGTTTFKIVLRKGVRFSDGSRLTAAVVRDSLERFSKAGGNFANYLGQIKSINAVGANTVVINLGAPDPILPWALSQRFLGGDIISEKGLANQSALGNETFGAGPYVLVPSQTVQGDHYAYVPNKYYWNKKAIHWSHVTVRVISNTNSALGALRTGQISFMTGDASTARAAADAGAVIRGAPSNFNGLFILDRAGSLYPALAKAEVRQAINYAINRKAISTALYGTLGTPTDQIQTAGWDGYDPKYQGHYAYDPAKAKQLLAAAGYPNGFTMNLAVLANGSSSLLAQAIASDLSKVGINIQTTTDTDFPKFAGDATGGKFASALLSWGGQPWYLQGQELLVPNALLNPFHTTDKTVVDWFDTANATGDPAKRNAIYQKMNNYVMNQGWFAPVVREDFVVFYSKKLGGVRATAVAAAPDPVDWFPKP